MLILVYLFLFSQEIIQLNEKPIKENAMELIEIFTFNSGSDEVDSAIKIKVASTGEIVAYNEASYLISIFDEKGNEIRSFGEAGDGLAQLNYQARFYLIHDHILFMKKENIFIYNLIGDMTANLEIEKSRSDLVQIPKGFRIDFYNQDNNPIDYIDYNMNGKIIDSKEFDYINVENALRNLDYQSYKSLLISEFKKRYELQAYIDGRYMYFNKGTYQIQIINPDFSIFKTLKRKINRVKPHPNFFKVTDWVNDVPITKDQPERKKAYLEVYGENLSDIIEINGQINGFIFVTRRNNKLGEYITDIISPNFNVLSSFNFKHKDLVSWDISGNKIIKYFFDYDAGPYIKIYDVKFKS